MSSPPLCSSIPAPLEPAAAASSATVDPGDGGPSEISEASSVRRTSAVTVLSTAHGRQRRAERNIHKRDLQAAVTYGNREPANICRRTGEQRWKFTYADVVYITDFSCRVEITSWPAPGAGLDVEEEPVSAKMWSRHQAATLRLRSEPSCWTSHTVVVVDQSG